jgi:hypothetical protein
MGPFFMVTIANGPFFNGPSTMCRARPYEKNSAFVNTVPRRDMFKRETHASD